MRFVFAIIGVFFFLAVPAKADVRIFVDSSNPAVPTVTFGGPFGAVGADVVNPFGIAGAPNGNSAFFPAGGFITFQSDDIFTATSVDLTVTGVTGASSVALVVGRLAAGPNGLLGFTAGQVGFIGFTVTPGANTLTAGGFAPFCAGFGGCDGFAIVTLSGTTLLADSIALNGVVASNPEPSVWALMILAFVTVGGRLKSLRRRKLAAAPANAAAAALA